MIMVVVLNGDVAFVLALAVAAVTGRSLDEGDFPVSDAVLGEGDTHGSMNVAAAADGGGKLGYQ